MKGRIISTAAALIAVAVLFSETVFASPSVSAQSALLYDCGSGRILWEKDADAPHLIASTTKIMTGLLICEQCDPDARVRIPEEAVGIEGSSLYLKAGEVLTVRQLLYGLLLQSGNDAAMALAIFCAGNAEDFVARMNEKAERLGLTHTEFANPHGLDDQKNYSTARDLALLADAAMDNPLFHEIAATKTVTIGNRTLANHNKLLWRYEGAVGVKTGFTKQAGRLLVSAAERNGRRLIAVTINAPDDWQDHTRMLDFGFAAFSQQTVLEAGVCLATVPVIGGMESACGAVAAESFSCALLPEEIPQIRLQLSRMAYAPVRAGAKAGVAEIWLKHDKIGEVELVWRQSVGQQSKTERHGFLSRWFGG